MSERYEILRCEKCGVPLPAYYEHKCDTLLRETARAMFIEARLSMLDYEQVAASVERILTDKLRSLLDECARAEDLLTKANYIIMSDRLRAEREKWGGKP